ncbi:MAG: DUF3987 domain-containing protein, partial [Desulfovibrio sp.]|nr:DUF3987 domain-containing protein [Desulfovibrio sp.]
MYNNFTPNYPILSNGQPSMTMSVYDNPLKFWEEWNRVYAECKTYMKNQYELQIQQQMQQRLNLLMCITPSKIQTTPLAVNQTFALSNPTIQKAMEAIGSITGWNQNAVLMTMLGFANLAIRGRFIVHPESNWNEHTPLYTMVVSESGTMKSKLYEIGAAPF